MTTAISRPQFPKNTPEAIKRSGGWCVCVSVPNKGTSFIWLAGNWSIEDIAKTIFTYTGGRVLGIERRERA